MKWIYLSPHLDDAAYSCGGLIHQQVQQGTAVEIWTLFAGQFTPGALSPFTKAIHQRWGTGDESITARRAEDARACTLLGASPRYFDFLDVIYRTNPISKQAEIINNEDLFRNRLPSDDELIRSITSSLQNALRSEHDFQLCIPLGLGNHIDHTLAHCAAENLPGLQRPAYYADFPYVLQNTLTVSKKNPTTFPLNTTDIIAWCDAIALYASQASTFWPDDQAMRNQVQAYWHQSGGSRIWFADQ